MSLFKASIDDLGVETLALEHASAIADIHAKTFTHYWTDGDFAALLAKDNVSGFLLRETFAKGGRTIGFVLVRVVADEAEILTIGVEPRWQNLGIGRKLMDLVIAKLHADRAQSLFLEVSQTNKSAVALYKRLGFEQVSKRENYYKLGNGGYANALVMRKQVG